MFENINCTVGLLQIQKFLVSFVRKYIAILIFPVSIKMLLHGVIGQMDSCVVDIIWIDAIVGAWQSYVTFFEHVYVLVLVK
jgi:hypothetical protein